MSVFYNHLILMPGILSGLQYQKLIAGSYNVYGFIYAERN